MKYNTSRGDRDFMRHLKTGFSYYKQSLFFAAFLVLVFLMSSCGVQGDPAKTTTSLGDEAETLEEVEEKEYAQSVFALEIMEKYQAAPGSVTLFEDEILFGDLSDYDLYSGKIQKEITLSPLFSMPEQEWCNALCCGEKEIITFCQNTVSEKIFLRAYNKEGEPLWETELTQTLEEIGVDAKEILPKVVGSNETGYLIQLAKYVLYVAGDGTIGEALPCPYIEFKDILYSNTEGENTFYVFMKAGGNKGTMIATLEPATMHITEVASVPMFYNDEIFETTKHAISGSGEIYFLDVLSQSLCTVSLVDNEVRRILLLTDYDMTSNAVLTYREVEDGFDFVLWDITGDGKSTELVQLRKGEGIPQGEEKKVLHMLAWSKDSLLSDRIMGFNRTNEIYEVKLDFMEKEYNSSVFSDDLLTQYQAKVVSGKYDLVYIPQEVFVRYESHDMFQNLLPMLPDSRIHLEDYYESVYAPFMVDDSLYAIPTGFCLQTLAIKKSSLPDQYNYGIEDFLDFLDNHKDIKMQWGGNKTVLLDYCMMNGWQGFVDLQSYQCDFTSDEFKAIIQKIDALELDKTLYYNNWDEVATDHEEILVELMITDPLQYEKECATYGEELAFLGYPREDGECTALLRLGNCLCILNNSKDPQGAFAFWEYYTAKAKEGNAVDYLPSTKEKLHELLGKRIIDAQEHVIGLTDAQQKMFIQAIEQASADTAIGMEIRVLIRQEMQDYFSHAKSLDIVCELLQSRVQLYLAENQ